MTMQGEDQFSPCCRVVPCGAMGICPRLKKGDIRHIQGLGVWAFFLLPRNDGHISPNYILEIMKPLSFFLFPNVYHKRVFFKLCDKQFGG